MLIAAQEIACKYSRLSMLLRTFQKFHADDITRFSIWSGTLIGGHSTNTLKLLFMNSRQKTEGPKQQM